MGKICGLFLVCCCKNKQSSNSNEIPDICHPLKGFFVLLPFCPNVRHFCRHNQSGDNKHSMMQMKWCLKPEADAGAAG